MKRFVPVLTFLYALVLSQNIQSQAPVYSDYIGAGHSEGITVSVSSAYTQPGLVRHAAGERTIDGGGLDAARMEASRFLAQAGLGGSPAEIDALAETLDFEGWIDWQYALDNYSAADRGYQAFETYNALTATTGGEAADFHFRHFQAGLWQSAFEDKDVLRQRVALAMSEIFVISSFSNLAGTGEAFASYYDILRKHADGNFRDLLIEISLHPAMGVYLSHFKNGKTDTEANTFPDENFARELMQLFTIGLYELNPDGTEKTDADGNPIEAYTSGDVRELSKVFTGLAAGGLNARGMQEGINLSWHTGRSFTDFSIPMAMHEDWHEPGPKHLLGNTINASDGMSDIEAAIDILFGHPNTGPFFAKHMIMQLVTSNPSPAYVGDVAAAFADNGEGVRGDIKAVVKAVLLHEEARDCLWQSTAEHGKLRTPTQRTMHMIRALASGLDTETPWVHYRRHFAASLHGPFMSPSVFNFYLPDHRPNGAIADMELKAPEFEIHNTLTSMAYINELDLATRGDRFFNSPLLNAPVPMAYAHYESTIVDTDVWINKLDVLFTHGRLSEETREILRKALNDYSPNASADAVKDRTDLAVFLMMISPDYTVLK